jgi:hypothetical protein
MPRRRLVNQNRTNLDRLTARWRARHDLRREGDPFRPRANPGREALARRGFPYRDVTPADYVAEHGSDMTGFTYDDESYADADLDAWIVEVGQLLRGEREGSAKSAPKPKPTTASAKPDSAKPKPEPKPASAKPKPKPKTASGKPKPSGDG